MLGTRRINIAHLQHLDREMTSPAGTIPATQFATGLSIVENHARGVAIDYFVKMVERIVGRIVQVHDQHLGAYFLQQLARERGHTALVHNARTALVQSVTQLRAQLDVIKQQCNRRRGMAHDSAPTRCSSTSLICTNSSAS